MRKNSLLVMLCLCAVAGVIRHWCWTPTCQSSSPASIGAPSADNGPGDSRPARLDGLPKGGETARSEGGTTLLQPTSGALSGSSEPVAVAKIEGDKDIVKMARRLRTSVTWIVQASGSKIAQWAPEVQRERSQFHDLAWRSPRNFRVVLELMRNEGTEEGQLALLSLLGGYDYEADSLLDRGFLVELARNVSSAEPEYVKRASAKALKAASLSAFTSHGWTETLDAASLTQLSSALRRDGESDMERETIADVLFVLGLHASRMPEIAATLRGFASDTKHDGSLRSSAWAAIWMAGTQNDDTTLALASQVIEADPSPLVRASAASQGVKLSSASGGSVLIDTPAKLEYLRTLQQAARSDPENSVRETAFSRLVELDQPETLAAVLDAIRDDRSTEVRRAIWGQVYLHGLVGIQTKYIAAGLDALGHESEASVRERIVRALGSGVDGFGRAHPWRGAFLPSQMSASQRQQILDTLARVAEADDDSRVQTAARKILGDVKAQESDSEHSGVSVEDLLPN